MRELLGRGEDAVRVHRNPVCTLSDKRSMTNTSEAPGALRRLYGLIRQENMKIFWGVDVKSVLADPNDSITYSTGQGYEKSHVLG